MLELTVSNSSLASLSEQALQYTVVLNGRINRDTTRRPRVGESADVYEGTLQPEGIKVAVKTIHAYPPETQEDIGRFLREIRLWSNLRHQNLQQLSGISTDFNKTISLIHPWLERGNAFDYVQDKSIDPRPLLLGIANGLHYLHSHTSGPILHGSLRGSNVLISDDGEARLIDFGLTALVNSTFGLPISTARIGAINWTAPECLEECEPALEQDIWTYGMTALELFTREPPFHDKRTIRVLMRRIMQGPPDRPSADSTQSRLTDGWWEICMSCWRRNPSERPGIADIIAKIAAELEKRA